MTLAEETNDRLAGSIWLKLGLKVDDIKDKLKDVGDKIKEGLDDKPVEDFNKKTKETENIADGLTAKFEGLAKTILAAFAVKSVSDFLNECEDLIKVQQQAEQKLESVMRSRFNATTQEINEIKSIASALQEVGTIGDEVTINAAAKLSTYISSAETLKTLLPSLQDIAVSKLGTDVDVGQLTDMAKTVGEALTEGTLAPLKSLELGVSAEAEEAFKGLNTEAERAAYLVDFVNEKIGKVNGSLSDTLTVETQLNNTVGDIKENVGSLYQLFIVPMRTMLLSIAQSVNNTLSTITSVLGVRMVQAENATNKAAESTSNYFKEATEDAEKLKKAIMGFDVIQKLNLTTDDNSSVLDSIGGDSEGTLSQAVKFEYEEGGFADRIVTALKTIGEGISTYISDKFGIAFDVTKIEGFVSKLEEFANWISENPEEFAEYCDRILGIAKAFGYLAIILTVIQWLGNLSNAVTGIASLFTTLGPILTNPWTLVVGVLAVVVTAFWYARDSIKEAFDNLVGYLTALWDWLISLGERVSNFWNGLWDGDSGSNRAKTGAISTNQPHFATGGYVSANTPTLAVVGDNRKQGEFILTDQQFAEAANKYGGGGNSESIAVQREILEAIRNLDLKAEFNMDTIAKFVLAYAAKQQRATGKPAL